MKVTKDMVCDFINDGAASAIQAAKDGADRIAAQMNAEIATNESHSSTNTINMSIVVKIDGDARKVEIEGGYGFKLPNLSDKAPKIVRDLPDPNQPELGLDETPEPPPIDATTPPPSYNEEPSYNEVVTAYENPTKSKEIG